MLLGGNVLYIAAPSHAFYVSITDVEFLEEWGDFRIKVKIFTNDLEDALEKAGFGRLYLATEKESPEARISIYQYIQQKLSLKVGKTPVNLSYEKVEYRDDACWIYAKVGQSCQWDSLWIENKILFELFDTQTNIIRLKVHGQRKTANLDRYVYAEEFIF